MPGVTTGATGIFGRRTGPDRALGEGMALAWDSGAALADGGDLPMTGHPPLLLDFEAVRDDDQFAHEQPPNGRPPLCSRRRGGTGQET